MGEYLSFQKMITPTLIQVIFWFAVFFIVIGALSTIFAGSGNGHVWVGLGTLLFGPVLARIYCEILIVLFRINDNVRELRHLKEKA